MANLLNAGYPFVAREPGAVGLTRKQFRQCVATKQARDVEVVPGLVELEVAVPRLTPAMR